MQRKADGMNYAPRGKAEAVCGAGRFPVGIIGLDHGHIYGMCGGLSEAGAGIELVFDPDPEKVGKFLAAFPGARAARSREEILESRRIKLVASACVPDGRAGLGIEVMEHGKDYFADKPPCTTLSQIDAARAKCAETGRKYAVYYSERLHVEAAVFAEKLIADGAVGRVVQVVNLAPHRINLSQRPEWFFHTERYGGIIVDLGCHQIEQFLFYSGSKTATLQSSQTANYNFKRYPDFEDFGSASFIGDSGAAGYMRVDWLTPDGLGAWGDGRCFILGTEGYIEIRKYIDIARNGEGDHVYLADHRGERHFCAAGQTGFPFFGRLIRDCLDRTAAAYDQDTFFNAIELAVIAQMAAIKAE
ncbi:MAG: Gfo/Idh/MocA family oxidoreductase [Spirochaetales bacterium]|jgi:predicted dehydrogenase|nr:Gfo/Idh/MocA family oxidoreductase [Spirochaetales bacterium]